MLLQTGQAADSQGGRTVSGRGDDSGFLKPFRASSWRAESFLHQTQFLEIWVLPAQTLELLKHDCPNSWGKAVGKLGPGFHPPSMPHQHPDPSGSKWLVEGSHEQEPRYTIPHLLPTDATHCSPGGQKAHRWLADGEGRLGQRAGHMQPHRPVPAFPRNCSHPPPLPG